VESTPTQPTQRFYVDTSVIVARYKPSDELYNSSERLFSQRGILLYVSPLSLAELYAVLSRVREQIHTPSSIHPSINTLVAFIVRECRLHIITQANSVTKKLGTTKLRTSPEYFISMKVAEKLQLKTLDLLHLAYASLARVRYRVNGFVTGDKEILDRSRLIRTALRLEVLHPVQVI